MTIEEIARLAKVSKSAVSLALNNKPGVSAATRETILEIAKANGYIPRVMVKADQVYDPVKAIRIVACIKEEVLHDGYQHEPFFSELINGLELENRKQGYTLFFSSITAGDIPKEIEKLESEFQSSGLVVIGTNLTREEAAQFHASHPNTVIIDTLYSECPGDFIVMNNFQGAREAADFLIRSGHRKIGYVQSRVRIKNFEERKQAFQARLGEQDLEPGKDWIYTVNPIIDKAQKDFEEIIITSENLPSALFCESDNIAIGVLKALQKHGYHVPQDISIIGFDDIPHCSIVTPALTSIRVEKGVMGSMAVRGLIEMLESGIDTVCRKTTIDTTLIERESVLVLGRR